MELGNLLYGHSRGNVQVNRDWQEEFSEFLRKAGFDSYGFADETHFKPFMKSLLDAMQFENDVFVLMPYYWGEEIKVQELPNFIHKESGYKLSWYKYPLRDSYANKDISLEDFDKILQDCLQSLSNKVIKEESP